MTTIINIFSNVLMVSYFLGMCFILNELKRKYNFPQRLFDFYNFYEFICENNPLLLNYYDTDNNTDNNTHNNLDKTILKEDILPSFKKGELFENKYLEKYKKFPNKYIFNDFELNEEKQIYESLITKYNDKKTNAIKEIQSELTKVEELQRIFNENRSINIIRKDDKYDYEVNDFAKKQLQQYFGIDDDNDDDIDNYETITETSESMDENDENSANKLYVKFLDEKQSFLKLLQIKQKEEIMDEAVREEAHNIIINKKLDKYIDNYVLEYTPLGNVYMRYNNDKKSFEYFSNNTIPYRYLEVIGRKYVMTFWCKPIFINLEEELKKAEEKYDEDKKKKENVSLEKQIIVTSDPKQIFAQLKNYNKDTKEKTIRPMKNRTNNSVLPPQIKANLPNVNNSSEKQLLKEYANRYTWEGRLTNFSPLKKIDKKVVDKHLTVSYADYKKMILKKD